jgi:hypothetical protein
MGTGVRWWFSGFWDGDNLGGFPSSGEVSKHQNMVKKEGKVRERCRNIMAERLACPGENIAFSI